jgi:cell division septation protein DedD
MLLSAFASEAGAESRSGPIVPEEPAGLKVWHEAQPLEAKTVFPAAALPPPPPEDVVVAAEVVVADEVVVAADVEPDAVTVCTTVADGFPSEV